LIGFILEFSLHGGELDKEGCTEVLPKVCGHCRIYRLIDTKYGIHGRIRTKSDFKRSLTQTEVNKLRLRKEKDTN